MVDRSGTSSASRARAVGIAWAGGLALIALHLDFWRPRRPQIWFGWMPEDLAWRLVWMFAAGGFVWFFTAVFSADEAPVDVADASARAKAGRSESR